MPVPLNTSSVDTYVGNDTASVFPLTFPTFESATIKAEVIFPDETVQELTPLTHYNLQEIGKKNPTATLVTGFEWVNPDGTLKTGYTFQVMFSDYAYQPASTYDLGRYAPITFTRVLDRLTMHINAVRYLASKSITVSGGGGANPGIVIPPLLGNEDKILQVNSDATGFVYGPKAQEIFDARDEAQTAAQNAEDSAIAAALSESNASDSAQAALESKENAELSEQNALTSETNAGLSADESEFWANIMQFTDTKILNFLDSPYNVPVLEEGFLYLVDTTDGDVELIMPPIINTGLAWKIGALKTSADANQVEVSGSGADNVNGGASATVSNQGTGMLVYANSPTNWKAAFIINATSSSSGGGSVPPGGDTGSVLTKVSASDGDVEWNTFGYEGFSARFNTAVNTANLDETLSMILNLQYLGPQVGLSASGSGTIREKGATVTASTLSANVTKRSNNIGRIQFFLGGVAIPGADYNPPGNTGSGTQTHNWTGSFSDNSTFRVDVTDVLAGGMGPTTVSASVNFNFVYPYYYGCGAPGLSSASVAGLTKNVIASSNNVNRTFTAAPSQVFYFAYLKSYGNLTLIQDENGFDVTSSFTRRDGSIVGLDGSSQVYSIYEFNVPSSGVTTNFTFIR